MVIETRRERPVELETLDLTINVGPQHPATHGVFRMVLTVDGEVVVDCEPYIGYMHRGAEKLCENNDYRQIIGYHDRTEYLSQFSAEHGYVLAVEKLAGLEAPERAEYIRVICAEFQRIHSHFMFMGAFGTDIGIFGTAFTYAFRERENIRDLFEEISGDNMMWSYFRVGGLAWEVPDDFEQHCRWLLKQVRRGIQDVDGLMSINEIFLTRTEGIGAVTGERAIAWGMSGPMLRASGVRHDIRRAQPYSLYDRFEFDVPTGKNGDVFDRYMVRLLEMEESCRIIEQALDQLPADGPIIADKLPRTMRPAPGEVYQPVESARGEYGVYIVSKGQGTPWRHKIRSASFSNVMALREMVRDTYVADAIVILGSTDIVLCEVDR
ncbi:MAG: NADH-quinone oxidoreductase subunit D [Dehalococcoidia bacterium]|nr:NADH-quinone oxidoreductase subunit D [Dehalococcoidia bacterium]